MTVSTHNAVQTAKKHKNTASLTPKLPIVFHVADDRPKRSELLPGFEPSRKQAVIIHVSRELPERLRGLKWTDYPLISEPIFAPNANYAGYTWPNDIIEFTADELKEALIHQPFFLYRENVSSKGSVLKEISDRRFFVAQLHAELCPEKPIRAQLMGQKEYIDIAPNELRDISAGWHHFDYNYKLNFSAIALKALDHVLFRFDPMPKQHVGPHANYEQRFKQNQIAKAQLGYQSHHYTFLTEPWGLQVLFALKKATPEERAEIYGYFSNQSLFYCPTPMTFGNFVRDGKWIGTGKYNGRLDLNLEIGWVIHDAIALGLVDMETGHEVILSPAGNAFLDIMHTDNDDPDAFMRFIDPATLSIPAKEIPRIDAWMTRFFRKMKVKVDKLRNE